MKIKITCECGNKEERKLECDDYRNETDGKFLRFQVCNVQGETCVSVGCRECGKGIYIIDG